MRERPAGVEDDEVLVAVREHWSCDLTRIGYLPVGFGAHHWGAYDEHGPSLFVTLDRLEPKRTAARLEAAYAGAGALRDRGLEFVVAPVTTTGGRRTIPLARGALSCTEWLDGDPGGDLDVAWTVDALERLHNVEPPDGLPPWRPLVPPHFADTMRRLTETSWGPGPYAEDARATVVGHLTGIARQTARYHHLAEIAHHRKWVATHGEPDSGNQLLTAVGRVLIDWESLKLAPAELDLRTLVDAGMPTGADPEMIELFDLEWRLDEISQYAVWFAAPHAGTPDDEIAFGGLLHELSRP